MKNQTTALFVMTASINDAKASESAHVLRNAACLSWPSTQCATPAGYRRITGIWMTGIAAGKPD